MTILLELADIVHFGLAVYLSNYSPVVESQLYLELLTCDGKPATPRATHLWWETRSKNSFMKRSLLKHVKQWIEAASVSKRERERSFLACSQP